MNNHPGRHSCKKKLGTSLKINKEGTRPNEPKDKNIDNIKGLPFEMLRRETVYVKKRIRKRMCKH